ncbi:hypothetical protein C1I99_29780 [Micromonospora deserti]|uniref:Uncharacterized protein n=1 Tax=Micromonospora deserti TaxID=2070366 RepID=A0A2W2CYB8_9ACTN|nr:hypothetical protein C1I99_29780 [Micromonospora deserti]
MGNLSGGGASAPAMTDRGARRARAGAAGPGEGSPAAILAATAAGIDWYGRRRGKVRRYRRA